MSIAENTALARKVIGSGLDVLEFFAEDAIWTIPGFGTYRGKQDIHDRLLAPTHELMQSMGESVITNVVAEGDQVVVESHATNRIAANGKPYNNTYCHVFTITDGKVRQVTEYADTALTKAVFSN